MKNKLLPLNILHIFNDGYLASFLLLSPFIAKSLHLSLTQVGFLGTLVNFFSIVLAIPAGFFALKLGGTRALLIGFFFAVLGFLAAGISPSFLFLILAFAIGGVGYGVFHPIAFAVIARSSEKAKRGREIGNFTAIGDIGKMSISAAITFLAVLIGWRFTTGIYVLVGLLALLFFFLFQKSQEAQEKEERISQHISFLEVLKNKRFLYASTTNMFDSFASSSLFIFLPFLFLQKGVNPSLLGSFTAAFFVGNFAGKTALGRFVDIFGNTKVFIAAELLMALFIFLLANTTSFILIVSASILLGIFTKGTVPVTQTMISEAAEDHGNFEKAFGVNAFTVSIATTIAPILLGFISDKLGIVSSFDTMALVAVLAIIPALSFHFESKKILVVPTIE